ncbi:MAG: hypothetical protein DRG78_18040 [Epsilonproteobacteria bacterium]|nr:MAG: hypothetical protein DRG78_18040 [Campylobacterota bacterium]
MAVNNITSVKPTPGVYQIATAVSTTGASGASADHGTHQSSPCTVHHRANSSSSYHSLNQANTGVEINHTDVNSLKNCFTTLSLDFKRGPTNKQGYINSMVPYFSNKSAKQKISAYEWSQVRNVVAAFSPSSTTSIARGSIIEAAFTNELKGLYDAYKVGCLCNSDCACNNVCNCNSNCSCNY